MKIIHLESWGILSEEERNRLEGTFFPNAEGVVDELRALFPNHKITPQNGQFRVTNKDGSVNAALFKEAGTENEWIQTNFGFRSIGGEGSDGSAPH